MTEHNERERAKSLAMLQEKGKHVLQNNFTPTPSHLTDIKVTMNCQADTMGFPRRCHK
jgi:hypothetical protein